MQQYNFCKEFKQKIFNSEEYFCNKFSAEKNTTIYFCQKFTQKIFSSEEYFCNKFSAEKNTTIYFCQKFTQKIFRAEEYFCKKCRQEKFAAEIIFVYRKFYLYKIFFVGLSKVFCKLKYFLGTSFPGSHVNCTYVRNILLISLL